MRNILVTLSLLISFNALADYSDPDSYPECQYADENVELELVQIEPNRYINDGNQFLYPTQMGPYEVQVFVDANCHEDIASIANAYLVKDNEGNIVLNHDYDVYNLRDVTPSKNFPFFILRRYTGGAHCCYTSHYFSKDKPYRLKETIHSRDIKPIYNDIDQDGEMEMIERDAIFTYWYVSSAASRFIEVIYRADKNGFHVAQDLIRQNMKYPTVQSALHQIRIEIKETKEHVIRYPHLAKNSYVKNQTFHDIGVFTAGFLYAGMEKEGWQFFNQIWAEEDLGITKRVSFRSELEDLITGSRHYQLLLGMDVESSEDHTANMIFQNIIKRFKKYQNSLLTNGSQEE